MQKDYWNICVRNFKALAILSGLAAVLFIFSGVIFLVVAAAVVSAFWFFLASMFKKRSPKAILVSYIVIIALVILSLIGNIADPKSINLSTIIVYLIDIYLLQCVYKAQKQAIPQTQAVTPTQPE